MPVKCIAMRYTQRSTNIKTSVYGVFHNNKKEPILDIDKTIYNIAR